MGLLPPVVRVAAGRILYTGRDGATRDLARLDEPGLRRLRGDEIAMVFQDPSASLNPVHRIGDQVAEAIRAHTDLSAGAAMGRAVDLLDRVGLPDAGRRA